MLREFFFSFWYEKLTLEIYSRILELCIQHLGRDDKFKWEIAKVKVYGVSLIFLILADKNIVFLVIRRSLCNRN